MRRAAGCLLAAAALAFTCVNSNPGTDGQPGPMSAGAVKELPVAPAATTSTTLVTEPVAEPAVAEVVEPETIEPSPTTTIYLDEEWGEEEWVEDKWLSDAPAAKSNYPEVSPADSAWAIPEYIVMCESGGDWNAENPSGAAGPYQLMPMHFGGESALDQSPEAQHAKAAELWAGGAGSSHWAECL